MAGKLTPQDITDDLPELLHFSAQQREALAALDCTISDTETTGLNESANGLSEFASLRARRSHPQDAPRLELLHAFILPLRPAYQDYLEAETHYREELKAYRTQKKRLAAKGKTAPAPPAPPVYDREQYEYDIAPQALAVTGTRFLRESPAGPIIGMRVLDKCYMAEGYEHLAPSPLAGRAYPFYEVWPDIAAFTRSGERDIYYNTPFDKPFLAQQIREIEAYRLAKTDVHIEDDSESPNKDTDPLYPAIKKRVPDLVDLPYDELTPDERDRLIKAIASLLPLPAHYRNSAEYQCLLYSTMQDAGIADSNTQDSAFRAIEPRHTIRAEHSAVEDVAMAAKIAVHRAARFQGDIPPMAELARLLAARIDPAVQLLPAQPRSTKKVGEWVEGDIRLQFSKPLPQLGEAGARLQRFLDAFDEARRRNRHVPPHLFGWSRNQTELHLNGERKKPLTLAFLKKWMFFAQLEASPLFEGFYPYDSTGSHVDVVLRDGTCIEDTHYGSLRANLAFFESHPSLTADALRLIGSLRAAERRLGIIRLEETPHNGLRLKLYGHQKTLGHVQIDLPPGLPLADTKDWLLPQLDRIIKLGMLPYVHQSAAEEDITSAAADDSADDGKKSAIPLSTSLASLDGANQEVCFTLDYPVVALMALAVQQSLDDWLAAGVMHTYRHQPLRIARAADGTHITLRGQMDDFWDFMQLTGDAPATDAPPMIGEKASGLIRNASWMMARLRQLPGTYSVECEGDSILLRQEDGTHSAAMHLLLRAGFPFKAYGDAIKLDARQLMQDAFHWSRSFEQWQQRLMDDARRPADDQRYPLPERLKTAQRELLHGALKSVEVDETGQVFALDGSYTHEVSTEAMHQRPRHYLINEAHSASSHWHYRKGRIDPLQSPIDGYQHLSIRQSDKGEQWLISPILYGLLKAANPAIAAIPSEKIAQQIRLQVPTEQIGEWKPQLLAMAEGLYALHRLSGNERQPIKKMRLEGEEALCLHLPYHRLFADTTLIKDLLALHPEATATALIDTSRQLQRSLPPAAGFDRRRADLWQLGTTLAGDIPTALRLHRQLQTLADAINQTNYSPRIQHDLHQLGQLLHDVSGELSRQRKSASDPDRLALLEEQQQWLHRLHEKCFRLHTASLRTTEAIHTLSKAIEPHADKGQINLPQAYQSLLVSLVDRFMLQSGEPASDAAARQQIEQFAGILRELWPDNESALGEQMRNGTEKRAYALLARLPNAHKAAPTITPLIRQLLLFSHPEWQTNQANALISLYGRSGDESAQRKLKAAFADSPHMADRLLEQYRLFAARQSGQSVDIPADTMARIDAQIDHAYHQRAQKYLILLGSLQDGTSLAASQPRWEEKARYCLKKAGVSSTRIDSAVADAKQQRHKEKRYLGAKEATQVSVPADSRDSQKLARIIDEPGVEGRLREVLTRLAQRKQAAHIDQLQAVFTDEYEEYRLRKDVLRALGVVKEELHDFMMIRLHMARDLSAAILQLHHDPQLPYSLAEEATGELQPIRHTLNLKPEAAGTDHMVMQGIRALEAPHQQRMADHAMGQLSDAGIPFEWDAQNHTLRLPLAPLALALPALAATDITVAKQDGVHPEKDRINPATAADMLAYALRCFRHSKKLGLDLYLHQPAVAADERAYASYHARISDTAPDIIGLCKSLAAAHAPIRYQEKDGIACLNVPMPLIAYAATMLQLAAQLQSVPAVNGLTVSDEGALQISLTPPAGRKATDALWGSLQLELIGQPFQPLSRAQFHQALAGTPATLSLTPLATLINAQLPPERPARAGDVIRASRALAMREGLPAKERGQLSASIRAATVKPKPAASWLKRAGYDDAAIHSVESALPAGRQARR